MLSNQELLGYIRNAYQEYQENGYNDTFDDFIERREKNEKYRYKNGAYGYDTTVGRKLYP